MKLLLGALSLVLLVPAAPAATGATGTSESATDTPRSSATTSAANQKAAPTIGARRQVRDLQHPWDVKPISGGRMLITERNSGHLLLWEAGVTRRVGFPSGRIWVSGETGLMSMEVDPNFADNGRFYTCSGWRKTGGGHDIRVIAWRLNGAGTRARLSEVLLGRFPTTSGRHGGCRLLITSGGLLMVGTGDAAVGRNPRNLKSLGGKTLRLNRLTGRPFPGNRWANSPNRRKRYVFTYGHRNVQGLAQRADGSIWSVEHGSTRDDEVNKLGRGRDYGWNPVPGYNESVPMTNTRLPGRQFRARWRSGSPTVATSGATWVRGEQWGTYQGTLAVACLKASRVIFMKFNRAGRLKWTRTPQRLRDFGRLRSVERAPNNDLLITTGNGSNDSVVRVSPR